MGRLNPAAPRSMVCSICKRAKVATRYNDAAPGDRINPKVAWFCTKCDFTGDPVQSRE